MILPIGLVAFGFSPPGFPGFADSWEAAEGFWLPRPWLRAEGCPAAEAELVARHLVEANLKGHDSHGVGMMPSYIQNTMNGACRRNHHAKIDRDNGAVIVVQEIFGVNSHIRQVADRFANYGYLAIAPALFDLVSPGTELAYDQEGVDRGRTLAEELGFNGALDGIRGVYDLVEVEFLFLVEARAAVGVEARGVAAVEAGDGAGGLGVVVVEAVHILDQPNPVQPTYAPRYPPRTQHGGQVPLHWVKIFLPGVHCCAAGQARRSRKARRMEEAGDRRAQESAASDRRTR